MLSRPDPTIVNTIQHAASLLTGSARRAFQAQVVLDHCNGNTHHAKLFFGWSEPALRKGLHERETGEIIHDAPRSGRTSYSTKLPNLQNDIRSLVWTCSPNWLTFFVSFEGAFSLRSCRFMSLVSHHKSNSVNWLGMMTS